LRRASNYREGRDRILSYIILKQPIQLDRAQVASMLGIAISTAGNYMAILANEYPDNLHYGRGSLTVLCTVPEDSLPITARLEAKQTTINTLKELGAKIEKNHLNHDDKEALGGAVWRLLQELKKL